jgi:hypothetical protein
VARLASSFLSGEPHLTPKTGKPKQEVIVNSKQKREAEDAARQQEWQANFDAFSYMNRQLAHIAPRLVEITSDQLYIFLNAVEQCCNGFMIDAAEARTLAEEILIQCGYAYERSELQLAGRIAKLEARLAKSEAA